MTAPATDYLPGTVVERTVQEWQVTGDPGVRFGAYRFVWRDDTEYDATGAVVVGHPEFPAALSAEQAARRFVSRLLRRRDDGTVESKWLVGPTLTHRTVVYTEWEAVPVDPEPPRR